MAVPSIANVANAVDSVAIVRVPIVSEVVGAESVIVADAPTSFGNYSRRVIGIVAAMTVPVGQPALGSTNFRGCFPSSAG